MPQSAKTLKPRNWPCVTRPNSTQHGYGYAHRKLREKVLKLYPTCYWCRCAPSTERDHVVPLSQGGADTVDNSVGACKPCNSARARIKERGGSNLHRFERNR